MTLASVYKDNQNENLTNKIETDVKNIWFIQIKMLTVNYKNTILFHLPVLNLNYHFKIKLLLQRTILYEIKYLGIRPTILI